MAAQRAEAFEVIERTDPDLVAAIVTFVVSLLTFPLLYAVWGSDTSSAFAQASFPPALAQTWTVHLGEVKSLLEVLCGVLLVLSYVTIATGHRPLAFAFFSVTSIALGVSINEMLSATQLAARVAANGNPSGTPGAASLTTVVLLSLTELYWLGRAAHRILSHYHPRPVATYAWERSDLSTMRPGA